MDIEHIRFKNRDDAFEQLCEVLPLDEMSQDNWIVLATSLGGVPIAKNLAKKLHADFDFIFTEKVFSPQNEECEIAIVTETSEIIVHEELMRSFSLDLDQIYDMANEKYKKDIVKYKKRYRDSKALIDLSNQNVLLVDEGLNTGLTMMACIKSVINEKAKSICVAVPILPEVTVSDIETIADDLYFVHSIAHFVSIDFYYENLEEIRYEDIKDKEKKE